MLALAAGGAYLTLVAPPHTSKTGNEDLPAAPQLRRPGSVPEESKNALTVKWEDAGVKRCKPQPAEGVASLDLREDTDGPCCQVSLAPRNDRKGRYELSCKLCGFRLSVDGDWPCSSLKLSIPCQTEGGQQ